MWTDHSIIAVEEADPIWIGHIGNKAIKIKQMTTEHLQYTIAMIKRGYDIKGRRVPDRCNASLPHLEAECIKRGLIPKEDGWDQ